MTGTTDLQEQLLEWGERTRRDLPWRRSRDPWAVLVSEVMLQQTQVARVVPRWSEFLDRFPTAPACAAAPAGAVVRLWTGLGYNRRALHLHAAARRCVEEFDGAVPSTIEELRTLPGVGAYTAHAVMAFAYELDVGVVDTNAARVLARVAGRRLTGKEAQERADTLVPPGASWAWNQAMLDLGAAVCTKRSTRCDSCPLAGSCGWAQAGCTDPDPAVGSFGVTARQSVFAGSDRQGRGRLVEALRLAPVSPTELASLMGWPDDPVRAARVATSVVVDGLAEVDGAGWLRLP